MKLPAVLLICAVPLTAFQCHSITRLDVGPSEPLQTATVQVLTKQFDDVVGALDSWARTKHFERGSCDKYATPLCVGFFARDTHISFTASLNAQENSVALVVIRTGGGSLGGVDDSLKQFLIGKGYAVRPGL